MERFSVYFFKELEGWFLTSILSPGDTVLHIKNFFMFFYKLNRGGEGEGEGVCARQLALLFLLDMIMKASYNI